MPASRVDSIVFETADLGFLQVLFAKLKEDVGAAGECVGHVHTFAPGSDMDAQMRAIDDDLSRQGFAPMSEEDIAMLKAAAGVKWPPRVRRCG